MKQIVPKPIILDASVRADLAKIRSLRKRSSVRVIDNFKEQLYEYCQMQYPSLSGNEVDEAIEKRMKKELGGLQELYSGKWVYFPWNNTLTHTLSPDKYHFVRTNRNRNLISKEEQKKFSNVHIGIAGLSVGSSIILTIVLEGGAHHITLADSDTLSLSNMNRIRASISDLGKPKIEIIAEQIYSMNPFAKLTLLPEGLTKKNINIFFKNLDIVIDEIDNLPMKFHIRKEAQERQIPVVSAADEGDSGVVEIERYDCDPETKFFDGKMEGHNVESVEKIPRSAIGALIATLLGPENIPTPMQQSLLEVGKTIVSWPQLGGTAALNGAIVAFCIRQIVSGKPLNTHAIVSLEKTLVPGFDSKTKMKERGRATNKFKKAYGL